MQRERKFIQVTTPATPGSMVFDQLGHVVGQVLACSDVGDATWEVEADVDHGTDVSRVQILSVSGITGSINNA